MGCISSDLSAIIPIQQPQQQHQKYQNSNPAYGQKPQTYSNQYNSYQPPNQQQMYPQNFQQPSNIWQVNPNPSYNEIQYQTKKSQVQLKTNTMNQSELTSYNTQIKLTGQYGSNPPQKVPNQGIRDNLKQEIILPDQQTFMNDIFSFIIQNRHLQCVLTAQVFQMLLPYYNNVYWSGDSKQQLISLLLNYIKFSISLLSKTQKNNTRYQLANFGQKYGRDLYKIVNSVEMKKTWILQILKYGPTFMKKKFFLENNSEILAMVEEAENLCNKNTSGLVYLSYYLVRCCSDLEKQKFTPSKINEKLKPIVVSLKQKFSPSNTLKKQKQYNQNRSFQQSQLNKIPSMNLAYKKKTFKFKTANKEEEMGDFIMEMVQLGKKHFSTFTKLTSSCCLQNGGFGYKSNLKLKERSQTMPLLRVKEKLLGDFISEYYKGKTYNCNTIDELQKAQVQYLEESLKKVYNKMDSIQFIVTDILRGKCMFNKISEINQTASSIIEQVKRRAERGEDIQVVSIDNRLMKITTDLMLRIRIQSIVCEFQIALKFNQAENQIHHKMYQVERSKVFSPVTMLFNWHDSISKQFFGEVDHVLEKYKNKDKGKKKEKESLMKIVKNVKNFMQFKIDQENKVKSFGIISQKDFEYLNRVKFEIRNMIVPQRLAQNVYMRTGVVMEEIKSFDQSLQNFENHLKVFPKDFYTFVELGFVLNKKGKSKQAFQKLIQFFNKIQEYKISLNQIDKKFLHKAIIELITSLSQLGKYQTAVQMLQKFQTEIYEAAYGTNSKQYAKFISMLAKMFSKQGKNKIAQQLFKRSIQIYEKIQANDQDPYFPEVYRLFSEVYLDKGVHSKSLQLLNKAQSLAENMFGKQSLEAGEVILAMGQTYFSMGRFQQCQNYYKKYEKLAEVLMDVDSTQYATAQFALVQLYISMHRLEQAKQILDKCSEISAKIWGQEGLQEAQLKNCQGLLMMQSNNIQEALNNFLKSAELLKNIQQEGSFLATIYNNIAVCYQRLGNIQQTLKYYKAQESLIKQTSGQDSSQMALCYNNFGNLLLNHGQYDSALQLLNLGKLIFEKNGTENNNTYLDVLQNIGGCYFGKGDTKLGIQYYTKVLSIDEVTAGKKSMQYGYRLRSLYIKLEGILTPEQKRQSLSEILQIFARNSHADTEEIRNQLEQL